MRIGFAVDRYDEGVGMANVVYNLAKQLGEDHDVVVLTYDRFLSEEFRELSEEQGIEVEVFKFRSRLRSRLAVRRYARRIEELDLDVVNAHGFGMALAAAVSEVPVLNTYHAHTLIWSEWKNHPVRMPLWVAEQAPSLYLSDEIVSISEYARNQLKKLYRKESDVIYNGIDLETYTPDREAGEAFLEEHDIDADKPVFGTLCMLREYKNIDLVLEALADMDGPYVYLVGGTGPRKEVLEEKAERLDINAEFLGFVPEDELPAFYAALDLFLFPSLWEGFGVPIVEAMACGTPVAAIDHKGPAELVEDGRSGFLLSRDPDDWTAVLREFIGDDRSMRESARHRAEQFSWERAARQYEEKLMELAE